MQAECVGVYVLKKELAHLGGFNKHVPFNWALFCDKMQKADSDATHDP